LTMYATRSSFPSRASINNWRTSAVFPAPGGPAITNTRSGARTRWSNSGSDGHRFGRSNEVARLRYPSSRSVKRLIDDVLPFPLFQFGLAPPPALIRGTEDVFESVLLDQAAPLRGTQAQFDCERPWAARAREAGHGVDHGVMPALPDLAAQEGPRA